MNKAIKYFYFLVSQKYFSLCICLHVRILTHVLFLAVLLLPRSSHRVSLLTFIPFLATPSPFHPLAFPIFGMQSLISHIIAGVVAAIFTVFPVFSQFSQCDFVFLFAFRFSAFCADVFVFLQLFKLSF